MPARKLFNLDQIAALQGAAADPAAAKTKAEADAAAVATAAAADELATKAAAAAAAAGTATDVGAEAKADTAAAAAEKPNEGVQAYLQAQIKDKDVQIVTLSVELTQLKAQIAEQEASFKGLLDIAAHSASTMSVACGGSALKLEGMTPTQVLAEHARLSETFTKKFPVGGVAAVDAAENAKGADGDAAGMALHQARVKAVR